MAVAVWASLALAAAEKVISSTSLGPAVNFYSDLLEA